MSTRKDLSRKGDRTRDRTIRSDLKGSIHRPHNQVTKNTRKRQHSGNQRSRIRNDTSQDGDRKRKSYGSMTGLLENSLETLRDSRKNTDRPRHDLHE